MLEGSVEMARAAASPHRGDLKGQSFSQTAHGVPGTVEVLEAAPQFPWEGQRRRALVDSWGGRSSPSVQIVGTLVLSQPRPRRAWPGPGTSLGRHWVHAGAGITPTGVQEEPVVPWPRLRASEGGGEESEVLESLGLAQPASIPLQGESLSCLNAMPSVGHWAHALSAAALGAGQGGA